MVKPVDIALAGHPFAPMGMGEHVRSVFRAFRAAAISARIRDIYALVPKQDPSFRNELSPHLRADLSQQVNVFHINADEVDQAVAHLGGKLANGALNVIYPAWELAIYPKAWAQRLELFDEVWVPSRFIFDSISAAVKKPAIHMPLACEVRVTRFMGRKYFGIPESSFVFLFYFDFTSYIQRKNPYAVLEAFRRVVRDLPSAHTTLVIKLNSGQHAPDDYKRFLEETGDLRDRVIILDRSLQDDEIKNLVRCCDCFVSLHRSEGFGRGLAEAMFLGKPVVATGYSGNLDFMTEENSCLVKHRLVPVPDGYYPHWKGQVWADPDIEHAAWYMERLLQDRSYAQRLGDTASRHIRTHFSYRACGLRYMDRIGQAINQLNSIGAAA